MALWSTLPVVPVFRVGITSVRARQFKALKHETTTSIIHCLRTDPMVIHNALIHLHSQDIANPSEFSLLKIIKDTTWFRTVTRFR